MEGEKRISEQDRETASGEKELGEQGRNATQRRLDEERTSRRPLDADETEPGPRRGEEGQQPV